MSRDGISVLGHGGEAMTLAVDESEEIRVGRHRTNRNTGARRGKDAPGLSGHEVDAVSLSGHEADGMSLSRHETDGITLPRHGTHEVALPRHDHGGSDAATTRNGCNDPVTT
jgi:hypothetical protein